MRAYQARNASGQCVTKAIPRQAVAALFETYPKSRKCDIVEGEESEHFFTVTFGRNAGQRWKDITRKTIDGLPILSADTVPEQPSCP